MSRGESSSVKPVPQKVGNTLLPLGNVACGILHYIASFTVIGNTYGQAIKAPRQFIGGYASAVFMVCILGLVIGTVQAAAIRHGRRANNDSDVSTATSVDLRWPLATVAGYLVWAPVTHLFILVFSPVFSSLESYSVPASVKIPIFCLLVLGGGVVIPGLTIGYAQYLALPHKTVNAVRWPLVQAAGLFLAVALPLLLPALLIYPIALANPGSDGSVMVLTMFIGVPAWLLLSGIFGILALRFTNLWLLENVFPPGIRNRRRA